MEALGRTLARSTDHLLVCMLVYSGYSSLYQTGARTTHLPKSNICALRGRRKKQLHCVLQGIVSLLFMLARQPAEAKSTQMFDTLTRQMPYRQQGGSAAHSCHTLAMICCGAPSILNPRPRRVPALEEANSVNPSLH